MPDTEAKELPVNSSGDLVVATPDKPKQFGKRHLPRDLRKPPRPDFLSARVKAAINRMVFYGDDREAAAIAVGLKDVSLRQAFLMPSVRRFYTEQMDVFRTSAQPKALRQIAHLATQAGSEKVQLDASKYLDGGEKQGGPSVIVNVGVAVAPGYMVDVGAEDKEARQIAHLGGSTRNALDDQ